MDVSAIRELLKLGETARALEALTALLESEKGFKTALRNFRRISCLPRRGVGLLS